MFIQELNQLEKDRKKILKERLETKKIINQINKYLTLKKYSILFFLGFFSNLFMFAFFFYHENNILTYLIFSLVYLIVSFIIDCEVYSKTTALILLVSYLSCPLIALILPIIQLKKEHFEKIKERQSLLPRKQYLDNKMRYYNNREHQIEQNINRLIFNNIENPILLDEIKNNKRLQDIASHYLNSINQNKDITSKNKEYKKENFTFNA